MSDALASMMEGDLFLPLVAVVVCIIIGAIVLLGKKEPSVLPLKEFTPFKLVKVEVISEDTKNFIFALPEDKVLGLPIGQHVTLKYMEQQDDGDLKPIMRSYTPTSMQSDKGFIRLLIKVYKGGVHPRFPNGGKMSQHLDNMNIGDDILMKGPKGHMEYLGNGKMTVVPMGRKKVPETRYCTTIGMMAGGTGITPMLQILHAIFTEHPTKNTNIRVKLLFANQTEADILVREELETLQKANPDRLSVHYTLDRPPTDGSWKYSTGFISKEMFKEHVMIEEGKKQQFLICGPPPMIKFACTPAMEAYGYDDKSWVMF